MIHLILCTKHLQFAMVCDIGLLL